MSMRKSKSRIQASESSRTSRPEFLHFCHFTFLIYFENYTKYFRRFEAFLKFKREYIDSSLHNLCFFICILNVCSVNVIIYITYKQIDQWREMAGKFKCQNIYHIYLVINIVTHIV